MNINYKIFSKKPFWKLNLILLFSTLTIFFLNLLIKGLSKGGRWDLNEQIALGENLYRNLPMYSSGVLDNFSVSSPYFPGVSFIHYLTKSLFDNIYYSNQFLIILSVIICVLSLYTTYLIGKKLFFKKNNNLYLYFFSIIICLHLSDFFFYANEFKPDSIIILLANILFLTNISKSNFYFKIFISIICLFLSLIFKQSGFINYILIFLIILLSSYFSNKQKLIYVISVLLIFFFTINFLFEIENLKYYTIDVMSSHRFNLKLFLLFSALGFINNFLIFISLLYALYFLIKEISLFQFKLNFIINYLNNPKVIFLIYAFIWFSFAVLGMAKQGGNVGNLETGLIPLIPISIYYLIKIIQKKSSVNKIINYIFPLIIFALLILNFNTLINNYKLYSQKKSSMEIIVNYLKENFMYKSALIDGDTYIYSMLSKIKPVTTIENIGHHNNMKNFDITNAMDLVNSKFYDLVILEEEPKFLPDEYRRAMLQNYIKKDSLPTELKEYFILVKK